MNNKLIQNLIDLFDDLNINEDIENKEIDYILKLTTKENKNV